MRTNLKVNSEMNGTLKMKNKNMVSSLLAGVALMLIATVGMSFTTEDTSRAGDSAFKNGLRNKEALTNMNSRIAALNPTKSELVKKADKNMDANFRTAERMAHKMAVAFGKSMSMELENADNAMNGVFYSNTLFANFNSELAEEMETADAGMDIAINDELEVKNLVVAFKKNMTPQLSEADAAMDVMFSANSIKNISPETGRAADKQMDATFVNLQSLAKGAVQADQLLDQMINQ
ncbi:MAG: hypothetical protein HEQ40_01175 [Lacibacter sp.]|jgi:hypothetical protein